MITETLENSYTIAEIETIIKASIQDINRFSEIYDLYYEQVFRFIYQRNGSKDESADIASTVFLKALENLKKYQFRGIPFLAWLLRIASNEVINFYRNKKIPVTYNLNLKEVQNMSDEIEESDFDNNWQNLINVMNKLSSEEMELLHLRYFDGFSYSRIGEILNISENGAAVKMHRIIQSLKKLLNNK